MGAVFGRAAGALNHAWSWGRGRMVDGQSLITPIISAERQAFHTFSRVI